MYEARVGPRLCGLGLVAAIWLLCSSSCVLEELTTAALCGQFDVAIPSCGTCSKDACCAEERTCRDSAACAALYDCLAPCAGDPACIAACGEAHPSDDAGRALANCYVTSCPLECAACSLGLVDADPSCDDCARTQCCDDVRPCIDHPSCGAILACVAGCSSPGCAGACRFSQTEGAADAEETLALYFDAANCAIGACQAACDLGTSWQCAGNHDWPLADQSLVEVGARFRGPTGTPAEGVTVKACEALDTNCTDPIATETTDADGRVTLPVPIPATGFTGYLETSGPDTIPNLVYMNEPLVLATRWGWTSLTTTEGDQVAAILGAPLDPNRGHLLVSIDDCLRTPGLGVELDVGAAADAQSTEFYFVNGLPSAVATATTGQGLGGFVNLQPGSLTLLARLEDSGDVVSTLVVKIRAGTLTDVNLAPDAR